MHIHILRICLIERDKASGDTCPGPEQAGLTHTCTWIINDVDASICLSYTSSTTPHRCARDKNQIVEHPMSIFCSLETKKRKNIHKISSHRRRSNHEAVTESEYLLFLLDVCVSVCVCLHQRSALIRLCYLSNGKGCAPRTEHNKLFTCSLLLSNDASDGNDSSSNGNNNNENPLNK